MDFKHTPAPWIHRSIELSDYRSLHIGNLEINRMVAHAYIHGKKISDEEKANALLISKAPEMLELLITIKLALDEGKTPEPTSYIHQIMDELIKEATTI